MDYTRNLEHWRPRCILLRRGHINLCLKSIGVAGGKNRGLFHKVHSVLNVAEIPHTDHLKKKDKRSALHEREWTINECVTLFNKHVFHFICNAQVRVLSYGIDKKKWF